MFCSIFQASEEDGKEKNREVERRELGKNLQEFKRQQEEAESLRVAEERKKDKAEEAAARERVRAQIAQDRAEKAARFNQVRPFFGLGLKGLGILFYPIINSGKYFT